MARADLPARGWKSTRWGGGALAAALLVVLAAAGAGARDLERQGARPPAQSGDPAPLWDFADPVLESRLGRAMQQIGLGGVLEARRLSVALVDLTDRAHPRVAAINGDEMFYAASLPKIAVMLAVFEKAAAGELALDPTTWQQLVRMIRSSSNADSTALMRKVGKDYIARVLVSSRYRLYDPAHNGGLWVGKDYAQQGLWRRDPLANLSHAATAMQVARFFYLLEAGALVNPHASRLMKEILGETALDHKFAKGLRRKRPRAALYRKSGTWRQFHADGALVERRDGTTYVAVALAASPQGGQWMPRIIVAMDGLLGSPSPGTPAPVLSMGGG